MSKDPTFRLAIHNISLDRVTPHWTFTCPNADVNVFASGLKDALKVSAHSETGYCQLKYHKHFADRNANVIDIDSEKWRIESWQYDTEKLPCRWLSVVFPLTAASKPRAQILGKNIELVDACDMDVTLRLLFVAPDSPMPGPILWSHELTNGVRFCLSIQYGKVNRPQIPTTPVRFFDEHNPEDLKRDGLRGVVLCDLDNAPCLYNVG